MVVKARTLPGLVFVQVEDPRVDFSPAMKPSGILFSSSELSCLSKEEFSTPMSSRLAGTCDF